jgi:hypothetical protein
VLLILFVEFERSNEAIIRKYKILFALAFWRLLREEVSLFEACMHHMAVRSSFLVPSEENTSGVGLFQSWQCWSHGSFP